MLSEDVKITGGKLSDNTTIKLEDGMVHYFTVAETTTSIRSLSSVKPRNEPERQTQNTRIKENTKSLSKFALQSTQKDLPQVGVVQNVTNFFVNFPLEN